MFNQFYTLDKRILGYSNIYQFEKQHLVYDDHIPGLVRSTRNIDYIADRIAPFTFEYFSEIKNHCYQSLYSVVSCEQKNLYDKIKEKIIGRMEKYINETHEIYLLFTALQSVLAGYVSVTLMKCLFGIEKSITLNTPKLEHFLKHRAKIDDKAIVWCVRRHEVELLSQSVQDPYVIDGTVSSENRHLIIQQFRQSVCGTLVAMIPVAKHGIDIYECDHAFFYGQSFDYESREQAAARIFMFNKNRPCYFYNMLYQNSLDERIEQSHKRKSNIIKEFIEKLKKNPQQTINEIKNL
jgi:superfamily II DNA or RNA helicase